MLILGTLFIIFSFLSASMLAWAAFAEAGSTRRSRFDQAMQEVIGAPQTAAQPTIEWEAPDRATSISKLIARMGWSDKLQLQLLRAGWVMRPSEFLAYASIASILMGGVMLLMNSFILVPIGFVAGYAGAYAVLISAQTKRNQMLSAQLPDVLDMLAASVRAGFAFSQGMNRVSTQTLPPISEEFGRALEEVQLGRSLSTALETMVARTGNYDLALMVSAVQTQLETGGNMAEVLSKISSMIRERVRLQGEINIASAEGKISAVVLIALPIGMALLIRGMSPRYLEPLFTTPIGRFIFWGAAGLMVVGAMILKRLVAIRI